MTIKEDAAAAFAGKRVVVAGAGKSGIAAAKLLKKLGAVPCIADKNVESLSWTAKAELAETGIKIKLGDHDPEVFKGAATVILSPGYPLAKLENELRGLQTAEKPVVMGELEFAWRFLSGETVVAVTGTSGKTTTVSLIADILREGGYEVFLGGNIGTPLSEYVLSGQKADVIVLETSSFQLQTCSTFAPDIAVCLNITPNHLDHHKDMNEYIAAKRKIFARQRKDALAILDPRVRNCFNGDLPSCNIAWIENCGDFPENKLIGRHNLLNIEAAWLACRHLNVAFEAAKEAIRKFESLPHRLETAGVIDGTLFVNDSKATTVSSLRAALESFSRPVLLLCGGKFKGGDLGSLRDLIKKRVKQIALFGGSREYFEEAWRDLVPIQWHPTLREAVLTLNSIKTPEDVVLLSPATSSYDQYANYEERGEDFKKIFRTLPR